MLRRCLITGAFVALNFTALAGAHPGPAQMLDNLDTNKDGMIVRDELLAARAERFARLDVNADGFLDKADRPEDRKAPRGERGERMHGRMDADGDGKVSKEEFINAGTPLFDRLDADHNSVLDAQEIEAAKAKGAQMRHHRRERAPAQP